MEETPNHLLPLLRHGSGMMTGWTNKLDGEGTQKKGGKDIKIWRN
jgi:hypothetical protein